MATTRASSQGTALETCLCRQWVALCCPWAIASSTWDPGALPPGMRLTFPSPTRRHGGAGGPRWRQDGLAIGFHKDGEVLYGRTDLGAFDRPVGAESQPFLGAGRWRKP